MRHRKIFFMTMIAALMLLVALPAMAADATTRPDPLPEWFYKDEVDAKFVKQHVVVPRSEDVMIIDCRPYMTKYAKGYIPTAYNLPPSDLDKIGEMLPENKDALLIFYCGGYHCKLSHKAAKAAEKLGYKNVKVYASGFPNWKKQGYDIGVESEYVKELLTDGKTPYLLVDARPHNKYLKGHIPSAISVSNTQFDEWKGVLPNDKGTMLIYYCGGFHCKLSHKSADQARKLGYTNIRINESGYPAWKKKFGAGQAIEVEISGSDGIMDLEQFKKIIAENPDSIQLIDVRDPDEFKKGHFPSAINMPVEEVDKKIDSFKGDKPIVFTCSTGARSGECFYMFMDKRPDLKDIYYLEATIEYNDDGTWDIKPNK